MFENRIVRAGSIDPREITPHKNNWRKHPKTQEKALHGVLDDVGWIQDVIINERTGRLIDGHLRVDLAIRAGEKSIPVKYVDLSEEEETKALITFDPISAMAEADRERLNALIERCKAGNEDVAGLLQNIAEKEKLAFGKKEVVEDNFELPDEIETDIERGDLILLGRHRLLCGDSTSAEDVGRLMDGKKADMVFTDPPYGVDYIAMRGGEKITNDSTAGEAYRAMASALGSLPTGVAFVCCSWRSLPITMDAMLDAGLKPKACIVWDKERGVQNLDKYYKQHEFVLYAGPYGGEKTVDGDVWKIPRDFDPDHPTPKPVALPARAINTASSEGQLVADPFLGSGTTLIAAEQLNRTCYGMEINPQYCEVICQRWEKLTSEKRTNIGGVGTK